MIATLSESASFWASIATLWGAAGAWGTYYGTVRRQRDERDVGLRNLLQGLTTELAIVSDWAGGGENNPGYLQRPVEALQTEQPGWTEPSRIIFSFECPVIRNLANSPYIRELGPIAEDVIKLSRSITRLFDYYQEYRQYVISRPSLNDSTTMKRMAQHAQEQQVELTDDERRYLGKVFEMNLKVHQNFIGGADSTDPLCLYKTFRKTDGAVSKFMERYKKPALPWWYWILHIVATLAFLKGLLLTLVWLGLC